ncbi:MAG: phosphate ABC transporter substrate-binding/OmpA family protein [Candidatus Binatia bacterium]
MGGQAKLPFYIALLVVVGGLIYFGLSRTDLLAPTGTQESQRTDSEETAIPPLTSPVGSGTTPSADEAAEAPDTSSVTTVKEYSFRPAERLPEVKGLSGYQPLQDHTVRFALNVWAGWGPIIFANNGLKAGKLWKTPDGQEFKLELVLIDNPVLMRDAYAAGEVHIGWATLDMVPLFLEGGFVDANGKPRDSRVMPRIYQQVDWSNGGDGIVVRENIKTVTDLRGKKLVLAQNSPSHYFALNMLVSGGVQPAEVQMVFTDDAFQAAAAFNTQQDLAGAVSWAPDIYNLANVRGNRMLVSTATANKLIADVWFARADFAKDHPGIVEALVRGIFDAMHDLKSEANRKRLAELMAQGYNIPATDALSMLGDAHNTNWGENYQFFLNQNNPTNFERIWNQAYYLYRRIGAITHQPVRFDQVMDYSLIAKLGKEKKYASQKDEYQIKLAPTTIGEIRAESEEILTNTIRIHFYPNSWDLQKKIVRTVDGKSVEELYDPKVDFILEDIARLVGQFGAARVIIEGHTDSSMKNQAPESLVKELSLNRANAVKQALVRKYNLDPNQFAVEGVGWDRPADPADPDNHAKNRRVEVRIYSAEKQ